MKLSNPKSLAALALGTALAGCGGGGTTTTFIGQIQANGLPYATNQTVQTSTLAQADSISAGNSRVAFASGTVLSGGSSAVSFEVVDATTIILTSGSNTWRLINTGSQGGNVDIWRAERNVNGNPSNLTATFGQYDQSNPNSFQSIFFGNIQELPIVVISGATLTGNTFAISGFETNPTEVDALSATATYTGAAIITSDETNASGPRLLMDSGTMNVNVNYSNGNDNTVTGTLQGAASGFGGGNLVLDLTQTDIRSNTNTFTTSFSRSSTSTSTGVTGMSGTLTGTLYGADAAEMGILLSGTAQTSSNGNVDAAGYALGKKQ